jgi:DNA-binding CsgD family transcriptional regulator
MLGNAAGARHFLDEAEAIAAEADDHVATIELIQAQTVHASFEGDMKTVSAKSSEGARLSRDAGDLLLLGSMLRNLATVALLEGDTGAVTARLSDALHLARQIDDRFAEYYVLSAYAYQAAVSGHPRRAAQLFGAAASVAAGAGADDRGPHTPSLAEARESATRALGEAKFGAAFEAGKRLTRQAALRLALGESHDQEIATAHGSEIGPLARRQVEVAQLVAEGLSNKQIAAMLLISDRTVATHVGHILDKLGFKSRAQIAGWISSDR